MNCQKCQKPMKRGAVIDVRWRKGYVYRRRECGYTYQVLKWCGTAVCHKKAHYHAVEMGGGAGARKKSAMNRAQTVQEAPPIEAGGA